MATMWWAPALAIGAGLALWYLAWPAAAMAWPFLLLWLAAPTVAWWISLPLQEKRAGIAAEVRDQPRRKLGGVESRASG